MRNVVFLVKNGIGFGHIRRALLLAERLDHHGGLRPIVISQARSLTLHATSRVRVVNLPLLHRVPSAVTADFHLALLDTLLARLDPVVVVEDTYPDPRYAALPSLDGVPRVLVMRRLDGLSFDQLRERGVFARYHEILIAQTSTEFAAEDHSGDTRAAVAASPRVRLVGPIHHIPTPDPIRAARHQYSPDGAPLVVVNGGAGGDQMPDGYGDRLFGACAQIAARFADDGHPARFVLVTGPYYAGRALADTPNTVVHRFTPDLPALLAAADVAVIKPGNNALSEALLGSARLVLVPDVSFMEGLDAHAARVIARHGGTVCPPDRSRLDTAIRTALTTTPRTPVHPDTSGVRAVLDAIDHHRNAPMPRIGGKHLLLIVRGPHGTRVLGPHGHRPVPITSLTDHPAKDPTPAVLVDGDQPPPVAPQAVVNAGTRVLIHPGPRLPPTVNRWMHLAPPTITPLTIPTTLLTPNTPRITGTARALQHLLDHHTATAVLLDLRTHPDPTDFLDRLLGWLAHQPVTLADTTDFTARAAERLLAPTL